MGKIYDALQRAEKEAKFNREKYQPLDKNDILKGKRNPGSKTKSTIAISDKQKHKNEDFQSPPKVSTLESQKSLFPTLRRISKKTKIEKEYNEQLFVVYNPNSIIAEQFRILRSRIFSFNKNNNIKTILVLSCLPEEGKSTVASNLSICIANAVNEHALLLDCDLRKPSIHKIFGLSSNFGLSNYLSGDIPLTNVLNKTKLVDKLTILPAGNIPHNPSELISSEKMRNLIQEVKAKYSDRYIILDSTPAQQTPEPEILVDLVDGIILVVRAGKTNRDIIAKTVKSLGKDKIIGVVFNMVREPVKSYFYNHYYSYYSQNH